MTERRNLSNSATRQCSRGHGTVAARGECGDCLKEWTSRKPAAAMTPAERAEEFRSWLVCEIEFRKIHERVEELVGRSVWTHEFAMPDQLVAEILGEGGPASMEDVMAKIHQLRPDMEVIVVNTDV